MSHFSLPADCTVGHAAALKAALQPLVTSDEATVVVSAADVERCDASLLQLLAALRARLVSNSRSLAIADASSPLVECAALLGLSNVISPRVGP